VDGSNEAHSVAPPQPSLLLLAALQSNPLAIRMSLSTGWKRYRG